MSATTERKRAQMRAYSRRRGLERREFVNKLKAAPCHDCGVEYPPYVMQFDHRDPEDKRHDVATLTRQNYSFDTLLEEIEKCDLVCANCHAVRTWGPGGTNR